jgi:acyl carrier protein
MIDKDQLYADLKGIITEISGIPEHQISGDANFIEDLGIESIMAIDIIVAIEAKYELQIPEEMYGEVNCLDSAVELIIGLMAKSEQ